MITEDYVSFETAKLLKEKGFDEKCKYVWKLDKANDPQDTDGISKICAERFMEGESFVNNSDIEKVSKYEDWLEDYHKAYLCPTLQMAMKWLRIEHNIHIEPHIVMTKHSYGYMPNYIDLKELKPHFPFKEIDFCNLEKYVCITYDKACEYTIKYCLENLIK